VVTKQLSKVIKSSILLIVLGIVSLLILGAIKQQFEPVANDLTVGASLDNIKGGVSTVRAMATQKSVINAMGGLNTVIDGASVLIALIVLIALSKAWYDYYGLVKKVVENNQTQN